MTEPAELRGSTRDERLAAARRVDWRFLLPSPALGGVAIAGSPDDELVRALAGANVSVRHVGSGHPPGSAFDTVVVPGMPDARTLGRAVAAVGPAGTLIVELDGIFGGRRAPHRRGVGDASRLTRRLRANGFTDIRAWLAWPRRDRATAWAPIDDPLAMAALVERRLGGARGAVAGWVARRLSGSVAGTALLGSVVPSITVVARRDRADVAGRPAGVLLLTPRFRASAHAVALTFERHGTLGRVDKLGRLADDRDLDHETAVLRALEPTLGATGRSPLVLEPPPGTAGWPTLSETALGGTALDPAAVRRDPAAALRDIGAWLAEMPTAPAATRETPVGDRLGSALDAIAVIARTAGARGAPGPIGSATSGPRGADLPALVERTRPLAARLAGASLPRTFEHGDPAHPNLIRLTDGRIGAVDWERGEPDGLPLHDLTLAVAYVAAAARSATTAADQAAAFADAVASPGGLAFATMDEAVIRAGVDPALRPSLIVAAFARTAGWLAAHLADRAVGDPAGTSGAATRAEGLADWLAGDRSVASWAAALALAERD